MQSQSPGEALDAVSRPANSLSPKKAVHQNHRLGRKREREKEQENDLEIQLALFHRDYGLVLGKEWVSNVKIVLIWCTAFFGHEEATFKTLHYHPKSSTQPSQRASIGTPPSLEVIV
jgi:hypothetical protein